MLGLLRHSGGRCLGESFHLYSREAIEAKKAGAKQSINVAEGAGFELLLFYG